MQGLKDLMLRSCLSHVVRCDFKGGGNLGKRKRLWLWFKRISCSKIAVLLAILGVWMIGSQVQQAHAQYSPGVAYQYYLLGEESDSVQQDSKDQKAAMNVGSLGSGGVAGEFSYDEIGRAHV